MAYGNAATACPRLALRASITPWLMRDEAREAREALEWLDGLCLIYPGTKIVDHVATIRAMLAERDQGPFGYQAGGHHADAQDDPRTAR
jgi:hypothetical protein